jgi:hypothetical protein
MIVFCLLCSPENGFNIIDVVRKIPEGKLKNDFGTEAVGRIIRPKQWNILLLFSPENHGHHR